MLAGGRTFSENGTVRMRILVMSDLHLEFERRGPSRPSKEWFALRDLRRRNPSHPKTGPWLGDIASAVDLVLLAGDIDLGTKGITYAAEIQQFLGAPVAMVAGNHEFYGHDAVALRGKLAQAAAEAGVAYLDDARLDLPVGDHRIVVLGSTLWTDYALDGMAEADVARAMLAASDGMNDHSEIRLGSAKWTPDDARRRHMESREWLVAEVTRVRAEPGGDQAALVIMTHHAPLRAANPLGSDHGGVAAAYASDMEAEIGEWSPDLWVWGHTHWPMDLQHGRTRLLSAPRGYIGAGSGAERYQPTIVTL